MTLLVVVLAAALVSLSSAAVSVVFAVLVLGAVAASVINVSFEVDRRTMLGAGLASGLMATMTGIGGPPMALCLQRENGSGLRAQLGSFLMVGATVSVFVLAAAGQVGRFDLIAAVVLLPFVALGFVISGPLRERVDGARLRPLVLGVAAASALALLLRTLL